MNPTQYIPGVCNIGEAEIARRKRIGWIGLIFTGALWAILFATAAPAWLRFVLFFPAAMSATGFIQGFSHFCAGFGMKGVFNFGTELYKTDTVAQAEYRAKDKRKAQVIFLYSILVGILVAAVAYLIH